jgi:hypothetical protein
MFDYIYSDKRNILRNPEKFIIFVKKLLPKYANSLPDSAAITLFREIKKLNKGRNNLIIETGVGASTIVMFIAAYFFNKKLYTFDINPDKIALIRQVINDAVCRPLKINIFNYWTYVPNNSLDKYTGIPALSELKNKPQFAFFDSLHSVEHLKEEVTEFLKISTNKLVIGLDDGNHSNSKFFPFGYTNMIRQKIGLKKIKNPKDNLSPSFFFEINKLLKNNCKLTKKIHTFFEKNFQNDMWFHYFGADMFYDGLNDKKNVDDFKYVNIFKKLSSKDKEIFKNRIVFFSVKK